MRRMRSQLTNAFTDSTTDAFWLAQVHFSIGNYTRALGILSREDLIARNPSCKYLAGYCYIKQSRYEEALNVLGDKNPVHLITTSDRARRKLQHLDARNGTGRSGKMPQRSDRADRSEERDREDAKNIRSEASMCYLRGLCYAKQNAFDRAKECYKDAVRIDVQCFEAFDQLMKNKLMSPGEEWEFLESLNFDSVSVSDNSSNTSQEAGEFVKMLYTTRLSKYARPEDFSAAIETLSTHYNLASNPSILLSKAELLYTHCRFRDSHELTKSILVDDPYNFAAIPLHVSILHELKLTNDLFLLSHDLADTHPDVPATWLAVGTYYLSINQIPSARSYFSKASLMDPHFGPAWIGFAHTFAAEGEHDQAISAYSTAARLFQGTHLPQLFLGMQNLCLGNLGLAREYLNTAYTMCDSDPLLLSEMGVGYYQEMRYEEAIRVLELALKIADDIGAQPGSWLATRENLGHAYRRMGRFEEALDCFSEVLRTGGKDAGVFSAKGLVLLELEDYYEAAVALHEALAIAPQDPMATELLARALDGLQSVNSIAGAEEAEMDRILGERKMRAVRKVGRTKRGGRRERYSVESESMQWDGDSSQMGLG